VLRELAELLESKGIEVSTPFTRGRTHARPHERLARRGERPYEQLLEMDEANSELATADVALVVGANDTVNPAAVDDPSSPIYGMPIIHADLAENVVFLKRSMRPGFAGIENDLLYNPRRRSSSVTQRTRSPRWWRPSRPTNSSVRSVARLRPG